MSVPGSALEDWGTIPPASHSTWSQPSGLHLSNFCRTHHWCQEILIWVQCVSKSINKMDRNHQKVKRLLLWHTLPAEQTHLKYCNIDEYPERHTIQKKQSFMQKLTWVKVVSLSAITPHRRTEVRDRSRCMPSTKTCSSSTRMPHRDSSLRDCGRVHKAWHSSACARRLQYDRSKLSSFVQPWKSYKE